METERGRVRANGCGRGETADKLVCNICVHSQAAHISGAGAATVRCPSDATGDEDCAIWSSCVWCSSPAVPIHRHRKAKRPAARRQKRLDCRRKVFID